MPDVAWAGLFFNARAACSLPGGDFRFVTILGVGRDTVVGQLVHRRRELKGSAKEPA